MSLSTPIILTLLLMILVPSLMQGPSHRLVYVIELARHGVAKEIRGGRWNLTSNPEWNKQPGDRVFPQG